MKFRSQWFGSKLVGSYGMEVAMDAAPLPLLHFSLNPLSLSVNPSSLFLSYFLSTQQGWEGPLLRAIYSSSVANNTVPRCIVQPRFLRIFQAENEPANLSYTTFPLCHFAFLFFSATKHNQYIFFLTFLQFFFFVAFTFWSPYVYIYPQKFVLFTALVYKENQFIVFNNFWWATEMSLFHFYYMHFSFFELFSKQQVGCCCCFWFCFIAFWFSENTFATSG